MQIDMGKVIKFFFLYQIVPNFDVSNVGFNQAWNIKHIHLTDNIPWD